MNRSSWWALTGVVCLGLILGLWAAPDVSGQQPSGRLIISDTDASTVPSITLSLYGMDGQGQPLVLSPTTVSIRHGQQEATEVSAAGQESKGTFTLFVVDIPPGVEDSLPDIQEAIEQYAAPGNMAEQLDYLAVYQIGENEAAELLSPTRFYNAVRNFFATPLTVQTGPTALLDSLGALLDDIESLQPEAGIYTSIVIFTDGTDVVSTEFQAEDIGPKANELGVPVHTVWLENENLQAFSQEAGRDYLAEVAAASRGLAARLDRTTEVQGLWDRIGAFRAHTMLAYTPADLISGQSTVKVSLVDDPGVSAEAEVTVQAAAPSVVINLPPESRDLTIERLDTPLALSFSASVSWLDGEAREVTSAQLLVNGLTVMDISPSDLDRFTVEVDNLAYGTNTVQITIVDELGQRASSTPITLNVSEGETQLPDEIRANGLANTPISRILLACGLILFILVLFALIIFIIRRWRKGRQELQGPGQAVEAPREEPVWHGAQSQAQDKLDQGPAPIPAAELAPELAANPYLEVLLSVTRMPDIIELTSVEHRVGRSPMDNDIVFENDITVSRVHASIVLEGSHYRIYDEGSTGGTLVNDRPVPDYGQQLADGDEVRLGSVRLRYRR